MSDNRTSGIEALRRRLTTGGGNRIHFTATQIEGAVQLAGRAALPRISDPGLRESAYRRPSRAGPSVCAWHSAPLRVFTHNIGKFEMPKTGTPPEAVRYSGGGAQRSRNARSQRRSGLRSPSFASSMILLAIISTGRSFRSLSRRATRTISNATPIDTYGLGIGFVAV